MLRQHDNWEQIGTAPKDGTHVLVSDGAIVAIAAWNQQNNCWSQEGYDSDDGAAGRTYHMAEPTKWQQLPNP